MCRIRRPIGRRRISACGSPPDPHPAAAVCGEARVGIRGRTVKYGSAPSCRGVTADRVRLYRLAAIPSAVHSALLRVEINGVLIRSLSLMVTFWPGFALASVDHTPTSPTHAANWPLAARQNLMNDRRARSFSGFAGT